VIRESEDRLGQGRRLLWIVIWLSLVLSLTTLGMVFQEMDSRRLTRTSIRFVLTLFLLYKLYTCRNWARITFGVLSSLAFVLAMFMIVNLDEGGPWHVRPLLLLACVIPGFNSWALLYSSSIRDYMAWRRGSAVAQSAGDLTELTERIDRRRARDSEE
jgi:peptidoglycan/LPS O-acetylase OafA/YrhL